VLTDDQSFVVGNIFEKFLKFFIALSVRRLERLKTKKFVSIEEEPEKYFATTSKQASKLPSGKALFKVN
jgi:hypothetical protein